MENQLDVGQLGQGLTGQVVLRGAETAGEEYQSRPIGCDSKSGDIVFQIIGDGGVPADRDADLRQAPAQPLAVGVQVLAACQLTADGNYFCFHMRLSISRQTDVGGILGPQPIAFQVFVFRQGAWTSIRYQNRTTKSADSNWGTWSLLTVRTCRGCELRGRLTARS